jgi:hypothetical protein
MVDLKSICEGRKARRISNCKFARGRGLLAKHGTVRKVLVPRVTTNSPMSGKGQKRRRRFQFAMSALSPIADIAGRQFDVRFVPKADIDRREECL